MAMAVLSGEYVPKWVYVGFFPEADEVALSSLARTWAAQAKACGERETELSTMLRGLASSFVGPAADAAVAKITAFGKYLDSTGAACTELAKTLSLQAAIVTFTKTAINVILAALQLKSQQLMGKKTGIDKLVVIVQLRQLQIAAQAQIRGVHDAAVAKLAGLKPSVDIQPALTMPKGTTSTFAPQSKGSLFGQHLPKGLAAGVPGSGGPAGPTADAGQDFWDASGLVGADEQQGPSPGAGMGTTASDAAFNDAEQQQIQNQWAGQMTEQLGAKPGGPAAGGNPTPSYTGEDLASAATGVTENELSAAPPGTIGGPGALITRSEVIGENPDGSGPYVTSRPPPTAEADHGPSSSAPTSSPDTNPVRQGADTSGSGAGRGAHAETNQSYPAAGSAPSYDAPPQGSDHRSSDTGRRSGGFEAPWDGGQREVGGQRGDWPTQAPSTNAPSGVVPWGSVYPGNADPGNADPGYAADPGRFPGSA
ncbi:MAG: hypothetical protein L0G99_15785, partial [Propionibacteriales bacterium]|nr:hypothetical protein [Propionibacteriales bacterium]